VLPVHNEKEVEEKFDNENAEVKIPEPIVNEEDNDWPMTDFEMDQLISGYFEKKGQTITI